MLGGEGRTQQHIGFTAEDVNGSEGEQTAKVDGVHLNHLARRVRRRHLTAPLIFLLTAPLIFLPLGADHILLGQHLVTLGHAQFEALLPLQGSRSRKGAIF